MKSVIAVLSGFFTVFVASIATDQLFHVLNVYPPWGEPMWSPWLNLLALSYRTIYAMAGGFVTASLAPRAPMRHVHVLAGIGTLLAILGAVFAITQANLGPVWYPVLLAVTSYPAVWFGGRTRHGSSSRPHRGAIR